MTNILNDNVEAALVALVSQVGLAEAVLVVPAKSAEGKAAPLVICEAECDEHDDPPMSGNFFVNAAVEVKAAATETADGNEAGAAAVAANQALVSQVFAALMVSDLPERMNALGMDLTVFPGMVQFGHQKGRDEQGVWSDVLTVRLYACASALAA
jgi:hypothetical protein